MRIISADHGHTWFSGMNNLTTSYAASEPGSENRGLAAGMRFMKSLWETHVKNVCEHGFPNHSRYIFGRGMSALLFRHVVGKG